MNAIEFVNSPDLLKEGQLEKVAAVAERVTGERPSPPSVYRWIKNGLAGGKARLHCKFHGGAWQTTEAAFRGFIEAQTVARREKSGEAPEPVDATDSELAQLGLI